MQKIGLIVLCAGLSGCAAYNNGFDCKPDKGIHCKSISKINKMVDKGDFNACSKDCCNEKIRKETIKIKDKTAFPMVLPKSFQESVVQRLPETTLKIWIAPYISDHDGYIESHTMHEILEPGTWVEERV